MPETGLGLGGIARTKLNPCSQVAYIPVKANRKMNWKKNVFPNSDKCQEKIKQGKDAERGDGVTPGLIF